MRSYEGQFSDNRPLKRTREEKQRQLRELKETLAGMKQHNASPALRTSIAAKIKELEVELAAPPPPPRERRGAPYQESFGTGPRPPRRPRPPREF
jgi:hypothetical protein